MTGFLMKIIIIFVLFMEILTKVILKRKQQKTNYSFLKKYSPVPLPSASSHWQVIQGGGWFLPVLEFDVVRYLQKELYFRKFNLKDRGSLKFHLGGLN